MIPVIQEMVQCAPLTVEANNPFMSVLILALPLYSHFFVCIFGLFFVNVSGHNPQDSKVAMQYWSCIFQYGVLIQ